MKRFLRITLRVLLGLLAFFIVLAIVLYAPDLPIDELENKYSTPESKFVKVMGMDVHVRETGRGTPLILLHGFASTLHTWGSWQARFSERFRVISLDLPGSGLTGPNAVGEYSQDYMLTFLDEFLRTMKVDTCYLVGNSMGGELAWRYALLHPERVKKLVLIDAAGWPRSPDELPMAIRLARTPYLRDLFPYIGLRALTAKSLSEVYVDQSKVTDSLIDRYYQLQRRPGNRAAMIQRINSIRFTNTDKLASLKMPVFILWGDTDNWIPLKHAYQFQKAIPNSKLVVFANTGHVPQEEAPDESVNAVKDWLYPPTPTTDMPPR